MSKNEPNDPMIDLVNAVRELERAKSKLDDTKDALERVKKQLAHAEEEDAFAYKNYQQCELRILNIIAKFPK